MAKPAEWADYDAKGFGTPKLFDKMTRQMRALPDQTGSLWMKGALISKAGNVFDSTAMQPGGQESTIVTVISHAD